MKRILTVALAIALVLGLAGTGMASEEVLADTEVETEVEEPEVEEPEVDDPEAEDGLSQGAVKCALVIDYTVPGADATGTSGSGTITLIATRGEHVETFTAEIPWGLTDEEAIAYISNTFGTLVEEKFGLQANSFKVNDLAFDEETSTTTATFKAIHGKAPVKLMPPGLAKKAAGSSEVLRHTERHSEHQAAKVAAKAASKAKGK